MAATEHLIELTEESNGALSAECGCGWHWGYYTADEDLAERAAAKHLDEINDGDDDDG